ncbi:unnamed protein product [Paramecium sonneborni]|uniref:Uncharacterized protein n=1 Tax=Paramecium sonneborni TaxID=65129 RepID=A0A8S1PJM5_9CILI|nr:unnamed protein product [Paramecium sonneborni]
MSINFQKQLILLSLFKWSIVIQKKFNAQKKIQISLDLSIVQHNKHLADYVIASISKERQKRYIHYAQKEEILKKDLSNRKQMVINKNCNMNLQQTQMIDINKQPIQLDHTYTKDQSDMILQYPPQSQMFLNKTNQSILQNWIPTLPSDESKLIEKNKKNLHFPRNIAYHDIIDGLNTIYGQEKNRRLWPGQEALLMETIRLYLRKIFLNPKLLIHSVPYILQQIIKIQELI